MAERLKSGINASLKTWMIRSKSARAILRWRSAVCAAFDATVENGVVTAIRTGFGGMAATPKRAPAFEAALTGKPWNMESVEAALPALAKDFTPLTDMRASAQYRLEAAQGLARRYFAEVSGQRTSVLEVRA